MNWLRVRYAIWSLISFGAVLVLAYGLVEANDPMLAELAILGCLVPVLMFLMGRKPENEDETAGIVSLDDDD